jgi:hypothetical protein
MPSQAEIARYMLETGIRQEGEKLYFDKVHVSHSNLAAALAKGKRVVTSTVKTIKKNRRLYSIFSKLQPTCNLVGIAPSLGWEIIGIEIHIPNKPGTIGNVTKLIGDMGVSIRQTQCPALSKDLLYIIAEDPINGSIVDELKKLPNIKSIKLFK